MRILFPDRIVSRHVGGNTTYARHLMSGVSAKGVEVGVIPSAKHPAATLALETISGMTRRTETVLHYSADTGPLLPTASPSVVTVHGVASRWIDVARTKRQEQVWRFRVSRAIRSTSRLITVSESAADDISEVFHLPRDVITVIPHGIDVIRFTKPTGLPPTLKELLPERFALYLGNIEPRKNIVQLVKAFEILKERGVDLPLVVAGRPAWNYGEAISVLKSAPDVIYLGFVTDEDRVALMQASSLFVFPSLYEGFGLPVLEAMAAGVPVAASRRGSLAEVGGPSYPIEALDAKGIADAVGRALADVSWLASSRVDGLAWTNRFKWEDSVNRHLEVYEDVLSG